MSTVSVVAGIVVEDGRVLLARRTQDQTFAGCWEFPGGKIEPGETPEYALTREFKEELGIEVVAVEVYEETSYRNQTGRKVHVRFYRSRRVKGTPATLEVAEVDWIPPSKLDALTIIPSNALVMNRLKQDLESGNWP